MPHPQDTVHRVCLCTRRKPTQYVVVYRDCPNPCQLFFAHGWRTGACASRWRLKPAPGAGFEATEAAREDLADPQSGRPWSPASSHPCPEKWLLERLSGSLPEERLWKRFSKHCVESPVPTARFASRRLVRSRSHAAVSTHACWMGDPRTTNGATWNRFRVAPSACARIAARSSFVRYGRRRYAS